MTVRVSDAVEAAAALWPPALAEDWDRPGLVSGDPQAPVRRIVLAVDAVPATVEDALGAQADLLLCHHPLLLRGASSVAEDGYKGVVLARLIRAGCALLTAHTNADAAAGGVADVLADRLGLIRRSPLVGEGGVGIGRTGELERAETLGRLARRLADILPPTAGGIRVAGDFDRPVRRVVLCPGAGDAFLADPAVRAADVYVTADLRHHPASEAIERSRLFGGPALIDVSHWASEWVWLAAAASGLRAALPGVEVSVSDARTDPWDFAVMQ